MSRTSGKATPAVPKPTRIVPTVPPPATETSVTVLKYRVVEIVVVLGPVTVSVIATPEELVPVTT